MKENNFQMEFGSKIQYYRCVLEMSFSRGQAQRGLPAAVRTPGSSAQGHRHTSLRRCAVSPPLSHTSHPAAGQQTSTPTGQDTEEHPRT